MTDLEWASAFVGGKFPGTGVRFNETVDVLVKKLAQLRQEASGNSLAPEMMSEHLAGPEQSLGSDAANEERTAASPHM
jgi:hypothetical protein